MGRALHLISLACCAFVVISFVLFAHTQLSGASKTQANLVAGTQSAAPARIHRVAQPRRFIDGVAGKLESPFTGLVHSDNAWVEELIPAALALLVYGGGLGFLARWASGVPSRRAYV
jgi:hypothetical protein